MTETDRSVSIYEAAWSAYLQGRRDGGDSASEAQIRQDFNLWFGWMTAVWEYGAE